MINVLMRASLLALAKSIDLLNRTLHGHLEKRNFSSRVEKIFHSFRTLTREIFFNIRREISYLRAAK